MAQQYEDLPTIILATGKDGTVKEGSIEEVIVELDGVTDSFIRVDDGYSTAAYTHAEVSKLGGDDPNFGIRRLAKHAIYGEPTVIGGVRPFNDELRQG